MSIDDPSQIVWLQLAIRSVYSGSKYRDVAITQLRLIRSTERLGRAKANKVEKYR